MSALVELTFTALIISVIVWGSFGYFIAPYLMGQKSFVRQHSPPVRVAQNIAAAAVAFSFPQVIVVQPAPHGVFQAPINMTGNSGAAFFYRLES